MYWRYGSSSRTPALQARSPEFKPCPTKGIIVIKITNAKKCFAE
jgi:hypothetical protein